MAEELCDQGNYDAAIEQLHQASRSAGLGDERKALVFKNRGLTLWKADRVDEALYDFERAWHLEKKLPQKP
jgi:Tfp pilus assembly protein PilF